MLVQSTTLLSNPLDSGIVLLALGGMVAGIFYRIWGPVKEFIRFRVTTVFEVTSNDSSFYWILTWLNSQKCTTNSWRSRYYHSSEGTDEELGRVRLGPGRGYRILKYKGKRIVAYVSEETLQNSEKVRERITFHMWGRKEKLLRDILKEAKELSIPKHDKIDVFKMTTYGDWYRTARVSKRHRNTLCLTQEQEEIFEDAERFANNRKWYDKHHVPYRRGYLLAGTPGTGKSSIAKSLASYLSRPLYMASVASVESDTDFEEAFAKVPENAILLLEDIDAADSVKSRDKDTRNAENNSKIEVELPKRGSLASLLNAIDGVAASEGRILIMTTNHPDKIDSALIRPGRCDKRIDFGRPTEEQLEALRHKFIGNNELQETYVWDNEKDKFMSMAEAQEFFLKHASAV